MIFIFANYIETFQKVVGFEKAKKFYYDFNKKYPFGNNLDRIEELKNYIDYNPDINSKMHQEFKYQNFCNKERILSDLELKIYSNVYKQTGNKYMRWDTFRLMIFKQLFETIPSTEYLVDEEFKRIMGDTL